MALQSRQVDGRSQEGLLQRMTTGLPHAGGGLDADSYFHCLKAACLPAEREQKMRLGPLMIDTVLNRRLSYDISRPLPGILTVKKNRHSSVRASVEGSTHGINKSEATELIGPARCSTLAVIGTKAGLAPHALSH